MTSLTCTSRFGSVGALTGAVALLVASAGGALAHHPMGGKMPSTFMEGLLSGLGHPVIGPDHLAFIVAIGIAAALMPAGIGLIAAFISSSTLGVLLHATALSLPIAEQVIAASVIVAGGMLALGHGARQPLWLTLAAAAGLFHGYAFGEAVVGAERGVIGAYLFGLAIIASIIAGAVMVFTRQVLVIGDARAGHLRNAGVMVACIGVVMLAGSLVAG